MTINCIFKCEICNEYICLDSGILSENGVRIPLNATGPDRYKGHECRRCNCNSSNSATTETKPEKTLDMIREHNEVMRKYTPWNYVKADESKFCRCSHHVRDHTHFWEGSEEVLCAFAYGNGRYPFSSRYRIKHCSCKGFVSYYRRTNKNDHE